MPVDVPQELLDSIVENVDDSPTLLACALVSTAFRVPSQRILFRNVDLHRAGTSFRGPTLSAAATLLTDSALLASYVRQLTIELSDTESECAALATIFLLVTNIKRLGLIDNSPTIMGRAMRSDVCAALVQCIARPSLQILCVAHTQELPFVVCAAMLAVPILSLQNTRMDRPENPEPHQRSLELKFIPRLYHLILSDPTSTALVLEFLLHPDNHRHTEHITDLEICPALNGNDDEPLFRACAATLEYLAFNFPAISPPISYSFPTMPCVRELKIRLDIDGHRGIQKAFPVLLTNAVAALPFLETIQLKFTIQLRRYRVEPDWDDHPEPFSNFATSEAVAAALPRLRRVWCRLVLMTLSANSAEIKRLMKQFAVMINDRMPGLRDKGVLAYEFEARSHPDWTGAKIGLSGSQDDGFILNFTYVS